MQQYIKKNSFFAHFVNYSVGNEGLCCLFASIANYFVCPVVRAVAETFDIDATETFET